MFLVVTDYREDFYASRAELREERDGPFLMAFTSFEPVTDAMMWMTLNRPGVHATLVWT